MDWKVLSKFNNEKIDPEPINNFINEIKKEAEALPEDFFMVLINGIITEKNGMEPQITANLYSKIHTQTHFIVAMEKFFDDIVLPGLQKYQVSPVVMFKILIDKIFDAMVKYNKNAMQGKQEAS